jgi:hypothetical protein
MDAGWLVVKASESSSVKEDAIQTDAFTEVVKL